MKPHFLLLGLLFKIFGLAEVQATTCKDPTNFPGVCCSPDLSQCTTCSTQCQAPGDTACDLSLAGSGPCTSLVNCVSSPIWMKTVSSSTFQMTTGSGTVLSPATDHTYFFNNPHPQECVPTTCQLFGAGAFNNFNSPPVCGMGLTTAYTSGYSFTTQQGLDIDTTNSFDMYACVSCQVAGGSTWIHSEIFRIYVQPTALPSCTTTSAHPGITTNTLNFHIENGIVPWYDIDYQGDSSSHCGVLSMQILTSDAAPTAHTQLTLVDTGQKWRIKLSDLSLQYQEFEIEFKLMITFVNSATQTVPISLTTGTNVGKFKSQCNSFSANPKFDSWPTVAGFTPGIEQSVSATSPRFILPSFTTSLLETDSTASCGVDTIEISTHPSTLVVPGDLDPVSIYSGTGASAVRQVTPTTTVSKKYEFYVKVTLHGLSSRFFDKYTLHVGCYAGTSFTDSNDFSTKYVEPRDSGLHVAVFTFTNFLTTNTNCGIVSTVVQDLTDSLGSPAANVYLSTSTCHPTCQVKVLQSALTQERTFTFKVRSNRHNSQYFESSLFTIEVRCPTGSSLLDMSGLVSSQSGYQNQVIRYYFNELTCAAAICCTFFDYYMMPSPVFNPANKLSPYPIPINAVSMRYFDFDSSSIGIFTFYLFAITSNGVQNSKTITVTITSVCSIAPTHTENTAEPQGSELAALKALGGSFEVEGTISILKISRKDSDSTASFDISNRFVSSQPAACPSANFKIDQVTAAGVAVSGYESALAVSSSGIFTFQHSGAFTLGTPIQVRFQVWDGVQWTAFTSHHLELTFVAGTLSLPPTAPYFVGDLPSVQLNKTLGATMATQLFALPEAFDPNNDTVSIKIEGLSENGLLVFQDGRLEVRINQAEASVNRTLKVVLTDSTGLSTSYEWPTEIKVMAPPSVVGVVKPPGDQPEAPQGETWTLDEEKKKQALISAEITDISNLGQLTVRFNQTMFKMPLDFLNASTIDLYLEPEGDRHLEPDFNMTLLNFTWKPISFDDGKILKFQMNFSEPLSISPLIVQDQLVLHFRDPVRPYLISYEDGIHYLHPDFWTLSSKVTRQMPVTAFTEGFELGTRTIEASLKTMLTIYLILNILFSGGLFYMLQLMRSMQIIIHFPLLAVVVPSNVNMFYSYLIPVVMFDILDPEWTTRLLLNFDEPRHEELEDEIIDQMKDLGYETHNSILNLGSLAIFLLAYIAKLGLLAVMLVVRKATGRGGWVIEKLSQTLFFNDLIALVLDAYFEFLISGYLQMKYPLWSYGGERLSSIIGSLALMLSLLWMPAVLGWQLTKSREEIDSREFKDRWGGLLDNMKSNTWGQRAYYLVFILRRFFYVLISVTLQTRYQFQILALVLLNEFYFIYLGQTRPHAYREMYRLEMANEWQIQVATLLLVVMTPWVDNDAHQYNWGGWGHVLIICLMIIINLLFIIKQSFGRLLIVGLAYKGRLQHLLLRFKLPRSRNQSLANEPEDSHITEDGESARASLCLKRAEGQCNEEDEVQAEDQPRSSLSFSLWKSRTGSHKGSSKINENQSTIQRNFSRSNSQAGAASNSHERGQDSESPWGRSELGVVNLDLEEIEMPHKLTNKQPKKLPYELPLDLPLEPRVTSNTKDRLGELQNQPDADGLLIMDQSGRATKRK